MNNYVMIYNLLYLKYIKCNTEQHTGLKLWSSSIYQAVMFCLQLLKYCLCSSRLWGNSVFEDITAVISVPFDWEFRPYLHLINFLPAH